MTKPIIMSWTIIGVPRMTVTYTLQMKLRMPRMMFFFLRCWSCAVRMEATMTPRTMPMSMAITVTYSVVPMPSRYCFQRSASMKA